MQTRWGSLKGGVNEPVGAFWSDTSVVRIRLEDMEITRREYVDRARSWQLWWWRFSCFDGLYLFLFSFFTTRCIYFYCMCMNIACVYVVHYLLCSKNPQMASFLLLISSCWLGVCIRLLCWFNGESSAWHKWKCSGKREIQLRNCFHHFGLQASLWGYFLY